MKTKNQKNVVNVSSIKSAGDDMEVLPMELSPKDLAFNIDRKAENNSIIKFQKSGDVSILEKIYNNRISTLQVWARRYYYLADDQADMFHIMTHHFLKTIRKYNQSIGDFNTYLYTSLLNCVRNIVNGKRAKKRTPYGMNKKDVLHNFLLSLDFSYDGKENSDNSLKDVIEDKNAINSLDNLKFEDTLNILSNSNEIIKDFLRDVGSGNSLVDAIKRFKKRDGLLHIGRIKAKELSAKKNSGKVKRLIKDKYESMGDFRLLDYKIIGAKLHYSLEMKKTEESSMILSSLRRLKKDRKNIIKKIRG